jgi:ATP-binding protein involved in chromosome partitioning
VIVSTPQDVALSDVRKGIAMLRKLAVPVRVLPSLLNLVLTLASQITGLLLNQAQFICPTCSTCHQLFGSSDSFHSTARRLGLKVLGELPVVPGVSGGGDTGIPFALIQDEEVGGRKWKEAMREVAEKVWRALT